MSILAARAGPPPGIRRLPAQQLARRELARSMYQPSLLDRIGRAIERWLSTLGSSGSTGSTSWVAPVLLTVLVLAVLVAVLYWVAGPGQGWRGSRMRTGPVLAGRPLSADEHRSAAERLAAAGDYQAAIIERFRAIAVGLEARQVVAARPGRTAVELAAETGLGIPAEASALASAARLFDDVRYGGRPGSVYGYQQVRDLDLRIQAVPIEVSGDQPAVVVPGGLPAAGIMLGSGDQAPGPAR